MVDTTNCLSEDPADLQNFQLGTQAAMFILRDAVGHHDLIQGGRIDTGDGITAEDTMSEQGVDVGGALLFQQLCGSCDGIRCVRQVIYKYGYFVRDISN
jgi:hypothetical protein